MPASLVFASFYLPVSVDTGSTSQRNDAVNTARLGQSGLRRLRFLVPEQWLLSPRSLLSQFHDFYWITNRRFDFFWFSSSNNNCLVENGLVENGLVENSLVENGLIQQHRSLQQNFFGFDTDENADFSLFSFLVRPRQTPTASSRTASSRIQKQIYVVQSPGRMAAPIAVLMESAQKKALWMGH